MPTARSARRTSGPTRRTKSKKNPRRATRSTTQAAVVAALGLNALLGARTEYRIYPSIGIARVGDCEDSFAIGPEAPGVAPSGPFRGTDGGIKPQAARFRIYKVAIDGNENETVIEEIVARNDIEIEWSVSLANRKAAGFQIMSTLARKPSKPRNDGLDREKLVIAADGSVSGSGTSGPVLAGSIEFAKPGTNGPNVTGIKLATLRTDEKGRLLVVGGPGKSGSPLSTPIPSFADNDGWYDSVSDGPVSATLRIGGQTQPVIPAWVLVTVPRYAPGMYGVVTWYDQAVSMARTREDGIFDRPRTTSFVHDIYPILRRADNLSGVHSVAHSNGGLRPLSDAARIESFESPSKRMALLKRLTPVATEATDAQELPPDQTMPDLFSGANPDPNGPAFTYLSLTRYQMAHVENWAHGNFVDDWEGVPPVPAPFEDIPVDRQAWALTEAALEACVGGPFYPGIEGTYDMARLATYHPESNLRRELRINPAHSAGFLTEKMALPWQADFADCGDFWWPSQRPDDVTTQLGDSVRWDRGVTGRARNAHLNMVSFWSQLGFVSLDQDTGKFIEVERNFGTAIV